VNSIPVPWDPETGDGHDTGDDCTRLKGTHTEEECRCYRDEMARREAHHTALGVGREYRRLQAAARGTLHEPRRTVGSRHRLLPAPDSLFHASQEEQNDTA